eukprot:2730807-Prymnesium_polylepis.2
MPRAESAAQSRLETFSWATFGTRRENSLCDCDSGRRTAAGRSRWICLRAWERVRDCERPVASTGRAGRLGRVGSVRGAHLTRGASHTPASRASTIASCARGWCNVQ